MREIILNKDWIVSYERGASRSMGFKEYLIRDNLIQGHDDVELIAEKLDLSDLTMVGSYRSCSFIGNSFDAVDMSKADIRNCSFLNNDFEKVTFSEGQKSRNVFHLNIFHDVNEVVDTGYIYSKKSILDPYSLNGVVNQGNVGMVDDRVCVGAGILENIFPSAHATLNKISYITGWNATYLHQVEKVNGVLRESSEWLQDHKDNFSLYGYIGGCIATGMLFSTVYNLITIPYSAFSGILVPEIAPAWSKMLNLAYVIGAGYASYYVGSGVSAIPHHSSSALSHGISGGLFVDVAGGEGSKDFDALSPRTQGRIRGSISEVSLRHLVDGYVMSPSRSERLGRGWDMVEGEAIEGLGNQIELDWVTL